MKRLFLLIVLISGTASLFAQQNLDFSGQRGIVSPEINDNNSVTLRLQAANAKEVFVTGDWIPAQGWMSGVEKMIKGEDGVWTYTSESLSSDLYSYSFLVDGLKMTDPNNVYFSRDVATVVNIFLHTSWL